MSIVCFPLMIGYSIYKFIETPIINSYYSFILQTLVRFVYLFGFILMTP